MVPKEKKMKAKFLKQQLKPVEIEITTDKWDNKVWIVANRECHSLEEAKLIRDEFNSNQFKLYYTGGK